MGCFAAGCLMLLFPRIALFVMWLATGWFSVFETSIWPFLGFFFMPCTTLAYMGGMLNAGRIEGVWFLLLIFGILCDLGSTGGSATSSHQEMG